MAASYNAKKIILKNFTFEIMDVKKCPVRSRVVNLPGNQSISQGSGKYWEIPGNRKQMGTQLWVANIMACSLNQS